jgi:hypothetical protein
MLQTVSFREIIFSREYFLRLSHIFRVSYIYIAHIILPDLTTVRETPVENFLVISPVDIRPISLFLGA